MMRLHNRLLLGSFVLILSTFSFAQNDNSDSAWLGKWILHLEQPRGELQGMLELVPEDGGIAGYVEGGPIAVTIVNGTIELRIDSRDAGARRFDRILSGSLSDNGSEINGSYVAERPGTHTLQDFSPRNWYAEPYQAVDTSMEPPAPVSLAGVWSPGPELDLRKYIMDTTAEAEAWTQAYDSTIDQPPLRCLSPGLVQLFGWPYPTEFVHAEDRIFLINEGFGQVREIFMDGREAPDYYPHSRMGYSVGHWEGSTLVVETTRIQSNIRDFRGEPFSNNAVVEERYTLSEDGQSMTGIMKLTDPDNFKRPVMRRVMRHREANNVILPYECDPDSFFRELYEDGRMEEYLDRVDRRL